MPESPEAFQRFVESEASLARRCRLAARVARSGPGVDVPVVATGTVSGFKDPRVPLVWPFWLEVFRRIPGLRVIPVLLLRSPHEIAMSIFMRSKGRLDYCDALTLPRSTSNGCMQSWPIGLARWPASASCPSTLSKTCVPRAGSWVWHGVKKSTCVFSTSSASTTRRRSWRTPAQALFEQLAALPAQELTRETAARIETDALIRERLLRRNQGTRQVELASTQTVLARVRAELSAAEAEAGRLAAELSASEDEAGSLAAKLYATEAEAGRLAAELSASEAEAEAGG